MSEVEPNIEEEVLATIKEIWSKYPSMRLTQLLVNVISPKDPCPDIFYVEDSKLINLLRQYEHK